MIVSELFAQVNWAFRGSDDDAPAVGTTDYTMWLGITNRKIHGYARDTKVARKSLFENRSLGAISTGTQTYDLDDDFVSPSDEVIVTTTTGHEVKYTIVEPQERGRGPRTVYVSGKDPQQLTFYDTITSTDQIVGGTISLGAFYMPDPLTAATDTIPVDDPYWLVCAVAATLASNDLTYESKYPDLNAEANDLYSMMTTANRRGTNNNPRVARTNVTRIPGARGNR